jgi:mRNA-degrading endonuclease RelE of RelBE toxin-antitoxin system
MMPAEDLKRINSAFEEMMIDPFAGDIKFLKGTSGKIRRRVGDWRVIFALDHHLVIVVELTRRSSTTY